MSVCKRAGMTLVELLIALAITTSIVASAAAVIHAHSYGMEMDRELRTSAVQAYVAGSRMNEAIRGSTRVLAQGENFVVLWRGDTRRTGEPNLSELQRIEWDEQAQVLLSYRSPEDLPEEDDPEYRLGTGNFDVRTQKHAGNEEFPETVWARGVTHWRLTYDASEPEDVRLVSYRMTVEKERSAQQQIASVALRKGEAPDE